MVRCFLNGGPGDCKTIETDELQVTVWFPDETGSRYHLITNDRGEPRTSGRDFLYQYDYLFDNPSLARSGVLSDLADRGLLHHT